MHKSSCTCSWRRQLSIQACRKLDISTLQRRHLNHLQVHASCPSRLPTDPERVFHTLEPRQKGHSKHSSSRQIYLMSKRDKIRTTQSMSNKNYGSIGRQAPLLIAMSEPVDSKNSPIRSGQQLALVFRVVEPLPQNCMPQPFTLCSYHRQKSYTLRIMTHQRIRHERRSMLYVVASGLRIPCDFEVQRVCWSKCRRHTSTNYEMHMLVSSPQGWCVVSVKAWTLFQKSFWEAAALVEKLRKWGSPEFSPPAPKQGGLNHRISGSIETYRMTLWKASFWERFLFWLEARGSLCQSQV